MAPHSSTLAWKISRQGGAWWAAVHGVSKTRTQLSNFTFTFHFHALEEEMATHSSVLAWRIPGTAEPGGLPSMGSHRVRHDWSDLATAATLGKTLHVMFLSLLFLTLSPAVFLNTLWSLQFFKHLNLRCLYSIVYVLLSPRTTLSGKNQQR